MVALQRVLNLLFVLTLALILLASFIYQFLKHEEPCSLCFLQRLGITAIAMALLLNLRFGIRAQHYGLAILSALLGRVVALRQISFHICPELPSAGQAVLGFDLYLWAFFIFTASLTGCALLLILYGYCKTQDLAPTWSLPERLTFWFVFILTAANIINVLFDCKLTLCV